MVWDRDGDVSNTAVHTNHFMLPVQAAYKVLSGAKNKCDSVCVHGYLLTVWNENKSSISTAGFFFQWHLRRVEATQHFHSLWLLQNITCVSIKNLRIFFSLHVCFVYRDVFNHILYVWPTLSDTGCTCQPQSWPQTDMWCFLLHTLTNTHTLTLYSIANLLLLLVVKRCKTKIFVACRLNEKLKPQGRHEVFFF